VIQTPAIIQVTPINTSMPNNTHLAAFPVHPCRYASLSSNPTSTLMTPLSYAAAAYTYWRGTINFRFQFVGTAYQQMTLAFVWIPDASGAISPTGGYAQNASYLYQHVVEVQGPREIECPIPYLGRQEAKIVGILGENAMEGDMYDDEAPMWESWNGVLHVYLVNKLTTSDNVPTMVDMVTWVSGGPDMEFHQPNAVNVAAIFPRSTNAELTWTEVIPPGIPNPVQKQAAQERSPFLRRIKELAGSSFHLLRPTSISTSANLAEQANEQEGAPDDPNPVQQPMALGPEMKLSKMFGESHMDMYSYMRRMQKVQHYQGGSTSIYAEGYSDHYQHRVFIPVTPQLSGISSFWDPGPEAIYNTPLAYFSRLAFYWRGGLEYRAVFTNPNAQSNIASVKASFVPLPYTHYGDAAMRTDVATPDNPDYGISTSWSRTANYHNAVPLYQDFIDLYGLELEQTFQQGTLSVTVPYMSHMNYSPLGSNTPTFSSADQSKQYYPLESVTGWLCFQITIDISGMAQIPGATAASTMKFPNFDLYIAAADDFKYLMQAPPGRALIYPLDSRSLPKD
jgi:hypothetical protein